MSLVLVPGEGGQEEQGKPIPLCARKGVRHEPLLEHLVRVKNGEPGDLLDATCYPLKTRCRYCDRDIMALSYFKCDWVVI